MGESFWEYGSAVLSYWQFWVAVAFMTERVVERFWPTIWRRFDYRFPADRRRQVFVWVAVVAFVWANFKAFDSERAAKEKAVADLTRVAKPPRDPTKLYQDGFPTAAVDRVQVDALNGIIGFGVVTASGDLEMTKPFEFKDWQLLCTGEADGNISFGAFRQIGYVNFVCKIQGSR